MKTLTTTSFGRRGLSAGQLATLKAVATPTPTARHDKWQILQDLTKARDIFGLRSRTLAVLTALVSFHPERVLSTDGPIIVFPSNRTLAERAHGISEPTLRRHITALVEAGLMLRHDSPNGKRYAARDGAGQITRAFGFDLRPLAQRASEIATAARKAEATAAALRQQREEVVLALRDACAYLQHAEEQGQLTDAEGTQGILATVKKRLRRHCTQEDLRRIHDEISAILTELKTALGQASGASDPIAKDGQSERHKEQQKPNLNYGDRIPLSSARQRKGQAARDSRAIATLPLATVLEQCPKLQAYLSTAIRSWSELVEGAHLLRRFLGIVDAVWNRAIAKAGEIGAAVGIAWLTERAHDIDCPSAYFASLIERGSDPRALFRRSDPRRQRIAELTAVNTRYVVSVERHGQACN